VGRRIVLYTCYNTPAYTSRPLVMLSCLLHRLATGVLVPSDDLEITFSAPSVARVPALPAAVILFAALLLFPRTWAGPRGSVRAQRAAVVEPHQAVSLQVEKSRPAREYRTGPYSGAPRTGLDRRPMSSIRRKKVLTTF
jgi:hypothetical protein